MYLVDDHRSTGNVILKQPGLTWNDTSMSSNTANFGNVMECWDLTKMGFIQPFYKLIQAVKQQHYVHQCSPLFTNNENHSACTTKKWSVAGWPFCFTSWWLVGWPPPIYRTSSDEFSDCSELKSTIWLIQPFLKNAGHINHYKPPWTKWVNSQSTTRFSMYREFKSKKNPIFYTLIRLNPIYMPRPNPLQLTYNVSSSHKMALSIRFGFPYTIYTLMVFFGVPMKPWWFNPIILTSRSPRGHHIGQ